MQDRTPDPATLELGRAAAARSGRCGTHTTMCRATGRRSRPPGLHPNACRSLADLRLFPFTTKQDLRDNYPFAMLAVPREQVSRVHASSGTTGRPTVVGYTAQECVETKDGLHVWEDHFYPEVVDPLSDEVLPDGEMGELVFTSLTKQAMPVVRYRTRDLTRLLPGTARPMRRMEKVTGRSDDMIILRGVNLFPTQVEELILRTSELSPHFQCVLRRDGRLDSMTVRVERRKRASAADAPGRARPWSGW